MRVRSSLLLLTSLLMVAACAEDVRQPEGPTVPGVSPLVSDGRNDGNPYFFFLPPDVSAPTINQVFNYANRKGTTIVVSAGNSAFDLDLSTRPDDTSPDYPEGTAYSRTVPWASVYLTKGIFWRSASV